MKTRIQTVVVLAVAGMLVACATKPVRNDGVGLQPLSERSQLRGVDAARIAVVNQAAAEKGVHVIWVNPPVKKLDES